MIQGLQYLAIYKEEAHQPVLTGFLQAGWDIMPVESLLEGRHNVMVGIYENAIHFTPIDVAIREKQKIGESWMKIVKILAS